MLEINYPWNTVQRSLVVNYPWLIEQAGAKGAHATDQKRVGAGVTEGGQFSTKDLSGSNLPKPVHTATVAYLEMNRKRVALAKAKGQLKKNPDSQVHQEKVKRLMAEHDEAVANFKSTQKFAAREGYQVNALGKWTNQGGEGEKSVSTKEPEYLGPAGTSVGEKLTLPEAPKKIGTKKGKALDTVKEAVSIIDEVHGDGELEPTQITHSDSLSNLGFYQYKVTVANGKFTPVYDIKFRQKDNPTPLITLVHEMGHRLDAQGLGKQGLYGEKVSQSHTQGDFTEWWNVVKGSKAAQKLVDLQKDDGRTVIELENGAQIVSAARVNKDYLNYLSRTDELFARSYAQYIATRSSNKNIKAEIKYEQDRYKSGDNVYPTQWEDDDFEPIAKEFDAMFAKKGWIKVG